MKFFCSFLSAGLGYVPVVPADICYLPKEHCHTEHKGTFLSPLGRASPANRAVAMRATRKTIAQAPRKHRSCSKEPPVQADKISSKIFCHLDVPTLFIIHLSTHCCWSACSQLGQSTQPWRRAPAEIPGQFAVLSQPQTGFYWWQVSMAPAAFVSSSLALLNAVSFQLSMLYSHMFIFCSPLIPSTHSD